MVKLKVTQPGGTVVEVEGEAAEVAQLLPTLVPGYTWTYAPPLAPPSVSPPHFTPFITPPPDVTF